MIRVLMISTDRKVFAPNSAVAERIIKYGKLVGELHVIVFSLATSGLEQKQIAPNVWLYPTNSGSRLGYVFDAYRIGKKILSIIYFGETCVSAQDPFETGLVGVFLRKKAKIPLQIQIHTDVWSYHFQASNFLNFFRTFFLAKFCLRRADGVRVVSEKIKRDVAVKAGVAPNKISVLPIYVDVSAFANAPVTVDLHQRYPWKTIILMASRLEAEKSVITALRALKNLKKKYPDVGLVIVGSGSQKFSLEHQAKRWGLEKRVAFEDWQRDLSSYYKTADIFLNTSLYEGYGMSLIEAGAAGLPLVTTKVGVGYDLLEDGRNALVCEVGDKGCVTNKLTILLENPSMRKSLGTELQKNIMERSISEEEYLKRMKGLFEKLFQ